MFAIVGISGYWFIDNKLNIPFDRIYAAKYVLLFSLFSFLIGLFKTPYESLIIENEMMAFYAYMSILDVVLKLLFVYSLFVVTFDKLIAYSLGIMFITLFNFLCTFIYCHRKFGYIRKWRRLNKNTFNSRMEAFGVFSFNVTKPRVEYIIKYFLWCNCKCGYGHSYSGKWCNKPVCCKLSGRIQTSNC